MTNFRNFDLNLLLVLDGVLREGPLSKAAKALNVSQPTISSSLAKLREILQDELFVRIAAATFPTLPKIGRQLVLRLRHHIRNPVEEIGEARAGRGTGPLLQEIRSRFDRACRSALMSDVLRLHGAS